MTTFITIIFVIVAMTMVLSILLQSGKGGGLGSALGGGASQSVFGGGGGADFMGKLTQVFAATFMISAMYLAYASAHAGSGFLEDKDEGSEGVFEAEAEVDYERIGPNPQILPTREEGKARQAAATIAVPAQSEAPSNPGNPAAPGDAAIRPANEPASPGTAGVGEDLGGVANDAMGASDLANDSSGESPQSGNLELKNPVESGHIESVVADPKLDETTGETATG